MSKDPRKLFLGPEMMYLRTFVLLLKGDPLRFEVGSQWCLPSECKGPL